MSAQEAKTFTDAIESAKDAASTVWTTIYTNVFGNYEEAKELWTDLANSLYEIFVDRLWDLNDVFEYWRSGGKSALESTLDQYEKELASLEKKTSPVQADMDRMRLLHSEIARLNEEIENTVFVDGRTKMFQVLYLISVQVGIKLLKIILVVRNYYHLVKNLELTALGSITLW